MEISIECKGPNMGKDGIHCDGCRKWREQEEQLEKESLDMAREYDLGNVIEQLGNDIEKYGHKTKIA